MTSLDEDDPLCEADVGAAIVLRERLRRRQRRRHGEEEEQVRKETCKSRASVPGLLNRHLGPY